MSAWIDSGGPNKLQRLVDQVRAEVEPQPRARTRALAPAVGHLRPEAVEVRVQFGHLAERAVLDQRT